MFQREQPLRKASETLQPRISSSTQERVRSKSEHSVTFSAVTQLNLLPRDNTANAISPAQVGQAHQVHDSRPDAKDESRRRSTIHDGWFDNPNIRNR